MNKLQGTIRRPLSTTMRANTKKQAITLTWRMAITFKRNTTRERLPSTIPHSTGTRLKLE